MIGIMISCYENTISSCDNAIWHHENTSAIWHHENKIFYDWDHDIMLWNHEIKLWQLDKTCFFIETMICWFKMWHMNKNTIFGNENVVSVDQNTLSGDWQHKIRFWNTCRFHQSVTLKPGSMGPPQGYTSGLLHAETNCT